MDLFEEYLNKKGQSKWVDRALTDPSYNYLRAKGIKKNNPKYDELTIPLPYNLDLSTLGDAIIKVIQTDLLLDNVEKLTEERKKYETDKVFVEKVAKHYKLIDYIDFDREDSNIPKDYNYDESKGINDNPHKYIATAVEAMIGAMYKEKEDFSLVYKLVESWMQL